MAHRVCSLRLQDTDLQFTAMLLRIILHEPPLPLRERISSTAATSAAHHSHPNRDAPCQKYRTIFPPKLRHLVAASASDAGGGRGEGGDWPKEGGARCRRPAAIQAQKRLGGNTQQLHQMPLQSRTIHTAQARNTRHRPTATALIDAQL